MRKVFRQLVWSTVLSLTFGCFDESSRPEDRRPGPGQVKKMIAELSGDPKGTVVYSGVALIDGTGTALQEDMAIIVSGERIEKIIPTAELAGKMPKGTEVVATEGWYALPGLIDSHIHLATLPDRTWAEATLKRYLYAGITGGRDMAGDARALADLARAALVKSIPAPDIYYSALMAGPSFFEDPRTIMSSLGVQPGFTSWTQAITDETDLPLAVAQARGTSATAVKIYANLPGYLVRNIIAEAHRQNFKVWTHLQVYPATPYDSIEAGADTLSHICMVPRYVLAPETQHYTLEPLDNLSEFSPDAPEVADMLAAIARYNNILDVTITLQKYIEENWPDPGNCNYDIAVALTKAAYEKGIRIVAGTDWSASADDPFPALYQELEAFTDDVGMSNMEAIQTATLHAAAALGLEDKIGTVEQGKLANLVFLKENPLEDISNLRSIVLTLKRGTPYKREAYRHQPIADPPGL